MPSLFILGDSTGCDYAPQADINYYYKRVGFGTRLKDYFKPELEIKNYAMSGRSSKSFTGEKQYTAYIEELKEGDFVIIAFGHNDEKKEDKTRYTDPFGGINDEGSFKNSLYANYIKPALDKGAYVTLCTPIVRRRPDEEEDWLEVCLHKANGGDYAQCIRELGAELNIPVTDNTLMTKMLYERLGGEETMYLHAWTSSKKISVDNTHLNNYGAGLIAWLIANDIKSGESPIKEFLKNEISPPNKDILIVNPEYHERIRVELKKSKLWTVPEPWWASVFGDMGGQDKLYEADETGAWVIDRLPVDKASGKTYYEISAKEEGGLSFHLRSGSFAEDGSAVTSVGKITPSTDGMAAVFRVVDGGVNFSISARAHINAISTNDDQVSFGAIILGSVGEVDTYSAEAYDYAAAGPLKMKGMYADEGKGNMWLGFAKADGALKSGAENKSLERPVKLPEKGDIVFVKLTKVGNSYTAEYNDAVSRLEADFGDEVYAGFFTARSADVTFTDIVFNNEVTE